MPPTVPTSPEQALDPERLHNRFGVQFDAGEVLFREGELGTEAYLLEEGRVRLIKKVRGQERSLMVLKPGDLFGESALIPGTARSSTAVALSPGLALALDQATLQNLLQRKGFASLNDVQEEGRLAQARASLKRLLTRRGLPLSPDEEARIAACSDRATLERWFDQAVTASSPAEALL